MSTQQPTLESLARSIDDLTEMVRDLAQMMSDGFAQLNARMDRLEQVSREHTLAIQELTVRVEKLELHLGGVDDDIKYLYKLIEALKKDLKKGHLSEEDTRSRLEEVEAIARQLSLKVGLKN